MAIIDELEGVLGKDVIAKIKANPKLHLKLNQGDGLRTAYYGSEDVDEDTTTTTPNTTTHTPSTTSSSGPSSLSLADIEGALAKQLGNIDERIDKRVTQTIEARAGEFLANASKIGLQRADELNRLYRRNVTELGEELDTEKFNAFVEEQQNSGVKFSSVTNAWEEFTRPQRTEAEVQKRVRDELKKKATENQGQHLPGVTPPNSKSPIAVLMNRGRAADGSTGETSVEKAGASLERRLRAQASEA